VYGENNEYPTRSRRVDVCVNRPPLIEKPARITAQAHYKRTAGPLPPYGNQINHADELIIIYCGQRAWRLASPERGRVASLIFPCGRDPEEYRWPVNGKSVLVLALDEPRQVVDILVVELLRQGADSVLIDYDGRGELTRYSARKRTAR
jgi:hypothetical protein